MEDDTARTMEHYCLEARLWAEACLAKLPGLSHRQEEHLALVCTKAQEDIEAGVRAAYLRLHAQQDGTPPRALALMLGTWLLRRTGQLVCNVIADEQRRELKQARKEIGG